MSTDITRNYRPYRGPLLTAILTVGCTALLWAASPTLERRFNKETFHDLRSILTALTIPIVLGAFGMMLTRFLALLGNKNLFHAKAPPKSAGLRGWFDVSFWIALAATLFLGIIGFQHSGRQLWIFIFFNGIGIVSIRYLFAPTHSIMKASKIIGTANPVAARIVCGILAVLTLSFSLLVVSQRM